MKTIYRSEYKTAVKTIQKKKQYFGRDHISLWPTLYSVKARIKHTKSL